MDSFCTCFILFIYFAFTSASDQSQYYKISMVSSESNPSRPALYAHGASPVWDALSQSLYFVDAHQQNVHRLDYSTGKIFTKHVGYGPVTVVSLVAGSRRLLVGARAALFLLDWAAAAAAALRPLAALDQGRPDHTLAYGAPDAHGRFWCGTSGPQTGDDVLPDKASLYSIDQERFTTPRVQVRPSSAIRGLAWAPNNSVLYFADAPTQKVEAFDFDPLKGEISARRTIIDITKYGYEEAVPGGMAVDSDGHLWVALMFGGTVLHIDPDERKVIYGYKVPASRVTAACWGGPNLDELFVTSSRDSQETSEPLAGAIFTIRNTGNRGLRTHAFKFDNADLY